MTHTHTAQSQAESVRHTNGPDQPLPKARSILRSDKSMRRKIYRELNYDGLGRAFWRPSFAALDRFFINQAIGHIFLECGELVYDQTADTEFFDLTYGLPTRHGKYFSEESETLAEIGSRSFLRAFGEEVDLFPVDQDGFIVVEGGSYRFKIALVQEKIIVRTIIHERIATLTTFTTC